MAIVWGPTGPNDFRLGIDVQGSVLIVYGQSVGFGHDWTATLSLGGAWGGSVSVSFYSGFGQTVTKEFYRRSVSSSGVYSASLDGFGQSQVSRQVSFGAAPAAPANCRFERTGPNSAVVKWDASAGATSYTLQRSITGGAWTNAGTVTGTQLSQSGLGSNGYYRWRVYASNSAGNSQYSNQPAPFYTTPNTPTNVSATPQANNGGVLIKWASNAYFRTGIQVERSDGLIINKGTGTGGLVSDVLDTNPGGVDIRYRVRHFAGADTANDRVFSAWSGWSNAVTTLAPPFAPSWSAPRGVVESGDVTVRWVHNPADGTGQAGWETRVRPVGTTVWDTHAGTTETVDVRDLSPGTYEGQARTLGTYEEWGPWCAVQTFEVIGQPSVTVTPLVSPYVSARVTVGWGFSQAQGRPQSAWEAHLIIDSAGVVEELSGSGPTGQAVFTSQLVDGAEYTVQVRAASGSVWSDWDTTVFTVEFVPPPVPDLQVGWDEQVGAHVIQAYPGEQGPGGTPATMLADGGRVLVDSGSWPTRPTGISHDGDSLAFDTTGQADDLVAFATPDGQVLLGDDPLVPTVSLSLERSLDGGLTWQTLADTAEMPIILQDFQGRTFGTTWYRATAHSELGATSTAEMEVVTRSDGIWLGGGPDYGRTVHLTRSPRISGGVDTNREVRYYSGSSMIVNGTPRGLTLRVGAIIQDDLGGTLVDDFLAVTRLPSPHLYRDATGRILAGALVDPSVDWDQTIHTPQGLEARWPVSFTIVEAKDG